MKKKQKLQTYNLLTLDKRMFVRNFWFQEMNRRYTDFQQH